ncbi:hypothetical protein Aperf_G00000050873 [Anoplocephala perfoliata]
MCFRYGSSGVCNKANATLSNAQNPIKFDSEYDYERHLVTKHLIDNAQPNAISRFKMANNIYPTSHSWTQYDSVVNMAAVLNDPTDRQLDIFSHYWGEAFERAIVPPSRIPVITEDYFFPYLSLISKRKQYLSIPQTPPKPCKSDWTKMNKWPQYNFSPTCLLEPLDKETESVYCSADFKLSNPETFNRVIPLYRRHQCSNLVEIFSRQSDRLSQHLDAVELAIVNHCNSPLTVSERSPAFFEAVQAHDVVKDQLSRTISQVNAVRTRLKEADAVYCHNIGQVVKLARRRENLKKVLAKLQVIHFMHSAQPTIQSLLQNDDFCSALDLITDTRESLATINADVSSTGHGAEIICLRHLDAQLTEIEKFISSMVESEFKSALHSFFTANAAENGDVNQLSDTLLPRILGVVRIGQVNFVDTIEKEVQQTLGEILEHSSVLLQFHENGHTQENTKGPQLEVSEAEPFSVWLEKLKIACLDVENLFNHVKLIVESVCSTNAGEGQEGRLRSIYWKAADRGQQKLASLISAYLRHSRQQQRGGLPIASSDDFVAFAQVIEGFHERTIIPAWRCYRPNLPITSQSMALRNLAATQAAILVKNFHNEQCRTLEEALNHETWRPAEKGLDPALAGLLNHLLTHHELAKSVAEKEEVKVDNASATTKLVLEGETYVVADSVLILIPLILDYLRLGEQLAIWPPLFRDVQKNLARFLTLFNSRSCKLVLGAEALERQLLKRIVARNMALVARSLECLLVLIPVFHVYFGRIHFKSIQSKADGQADHNGLSRFVDPFHDVKQAIQSHISEVLGMLTGLLATNISRAMHTWRPRPPTPSTEMRLVCQALSKLIESTSGILSEEMLNNLLLRAHVEFKANLRQRLTDLGVYPDGGPQQGLVNSELVFYMNFFCGLTSSLKNFKDECEEIWPSRESTAGAN